MRKINFIFQCVWAPISFIVQSLCTIIFFVVQFLFALLIVCLWLIFRIIISLLCVFFRILVRCCINLFRNVIQHPKIFIVIVLALVFGFEIYWIKDDLVSVFQSQISWVSLGTILGIFLLVFLWLKSPIKKIFGEGKGITRSRFRVTLNSILIFLFLLPFEVYVLKVSLSPQVNDYISGLSIIGVSITLAGLLLASARISQITPKKRQELICVSQKFVMTTVLLIFAVISIFMIDKGLNGINVDTFAFGEPINYYRGFLFWIAAPFFHGSLILFIIGLSDLVFAFFDLDTRPTIPD